MKRKYIFPLIMVIGGIVCIILTFAIIGPFQEENLFWIKTVKDISGINASISTDGKNFLIVYPAGNKIDLKVFNYKGEQCATGIISAASPTTVELLYNLEKKHFSLLYKEGNKVIAKTLGIGNGNVTSDKTSTLYSSTVNFPSFKAVTDSVKGNYFCVVEAKNSWFRLMIRNPDLSTKASKNYDLINVVNYKIAAYNRFLYYLFITEYPTNKTTIRVLNDSLGQTDIKTVNAIDVNYVYDTNRDEGVIIGKFLDNNVWRYKVYSLQLDNSGKITFNELIDFGDATDESISKSLYIPIYDWLTFCRKGAITSIDLETYDIYDDSLLSSVVSENSIVCYAPINKYLCVLSPQPYTAIRPNTKVHFLIPQYKTVFVTNNLDMPNSFDNIQDAVTSAFSGDFVRVEPKDNDPEVDTEYNCINGEENYSEWLLEIDKDLTIYGVGEKIKLKPGIKNTSGDLCDNVIKCKDYSLKVYDLKFERPVGGGSAIWLDNPHGDSKIENVETNGFNQTIKITGKHVENTKIERCKIVDFKAIGILLDSTDSVNSNIEILNNIVSSNVALSSAYGISLNNCYYVDIDGNIMEGMPYGIKIDGTMYTVSIKNNIMFVTNTPIGKGNSYQYSNNTTNITYNFSNQQFGNFTEPCFTMNNNTGKLTATPYNTITYKLTNNSPCLNAGDGLDRDITQADGGRYGGRDSGLQW